MAELTQETPNQIQQPDAANEQAQPPGIPVINPDGQVVAIDPNDLTDALNQGYLQASPQDVHEHIMQSRYGSAGQQAIAGLEGAAEGVSFGTSPAVEKMFGVNPEDIRNREEANPATHVLGQTAGLIGSSLIPGVGEANALRAAGETGAALLGAKAGGSFISHVSERAVQGAFEGLLFQASDELGKAFKEDPNQTAESAIANIGLGAVLGGVFGGTFGAAAQGLKKVAPLADRYLPKFVSEIDRPALEAGDFATSIKASNLIDDADKENILSSITKEKPEAPELRRIGEENGLPVLEGMTSASSLVQKAESSLIHSQGSMVADARRALYDQGYNSAVGIMDGITGANNQFSKAELGSYMKDGLIREIEAQSAPVEQMYKMIKEKSQIIPIEPKLLEGAKAEIAKMPELRISSNFPGGQLVKNVLNSLENVKTADDLKVLMSDLNVPWTASSKEKFLAGTLREKLSNLMDDSVERFAYDSAGTSEVQRQVTDLIAQRKAANSRYKELMGDVGQLAEKLGKGRIHGVQDAVNFIKEGVTPEEVVQKLFSKKDSEFLKFFSKRFPQQMEALKEYQKSELREAASKTGVFSPKVYFNNINKLEPEIKSTLFSKVESKKLNDMETYLRSFPKDHNPSGTAHMMDLKGRWGQVAGGAGAGFTIAGPIGAAVGAGLGYASNEIRDAAIQKFITAARNFPEMQGAQKLAQATIRGWKAANNGVKAVFDPARKVVASNVIDMESYRNKIDKYVGEYQSNPEKLMHINDNNPIPTYSTSFAATSARAVQYLAALKPNTSIANILDSKPTPSLQQLSEYNRALNIAHEPLRVLSSVKDGSVTVQDITALKAMYPSLYTSLSQKLQAEMIETVSKGQTVPYKTRLGLSMFLMQPMDSTMTPAAIQAAQMTMAPAQTPQQGQPAAPIKRSTAALSKMSQGYQTPGQAREARSVKR